MLKPEYRYWVLWLFLLGVLFIVFLQVVSGYNINRLIQGNKSLLQHLSVQNELRKLESDILIVESDIRGAVITENAELLSNIEIKINDIDTSLRFLDKRFTNQVPAALIGRLKRLVASKTRFSNSIVTAFFTEGNAAAEEIINSNKGQLIRDSIILSINQLDSLRQAKLAGVTASYEITGSNARLWGVIVTTIALFAVVLAFWYVLNQGRQQQKIIRLLNESDKRNREVADMKEQFLANMSHEIRTPMNSILGFTNILRRTQLNDQQREYVQNIHSAGENLLALVNDILDLSKIEAGMMQLEEIRFSIQSLIGSVGAMFTEKMTEKNLEFGVIIESDVPDILQGDAVRLTQILVNLVSNAVKFTEKGKITVSVKLLKLKEDNVRIAITVSDTGIGIAPDKQAAIFERFQQAEAAITRRFGGTGLGLAIVKQLVDLQNGKIGLKSEPGNGTEFLVELDYKVPDADKLFLEALAAESEPVSLQKIKALIAEDNLMNQQLIEHLMKSWAIDCKIVDNGARAIEELKREKYSIVLMDIQMPVMDGYTATGIIRNELKNDIPIIAMTAHAMMGEKEKCLQMGMNDYVSKPIKETVLYNIISRHAQQPTESSSPAFRHLDLANLHELSGNDRDFEFKILKQFIVQVPGELNSLKKALLEKDYNAVINIAHSMKSTVSYVGLADELIPVLDRIEKNTREGSDDSYAADLSIVEQKCLFAIAEIEEYLQNS